MPWTHLHAWADAQNSEKLYLILRGDLIFDERDLPQTNWDDQGATPAVSLIDAFFSGQQLGRNGFLRPLQTDVVLNVSCYGPWCASAVSGVTFIAFAEMVDGTLIIETNPCGGFLFPATAEIEEDLTRCMRGERCALP